MSPRQNKTPPISQKVCTKMVEKCSVNTSPIMALEKLNFFGVLLRLLLRRLDFFTLAFLGIDSKQNQKFAGKINTEPLLLLPSLCHDRPT